MQHKKISVIQAPFGLGSGRPGTELGPESMRVAGLLRQLRQIGLEAEEHTVTVSAPGAPGTSSAVKHLSEVMEMSRRVAGLVSDAAAEGSFPLVVGGDRSVAIGAFAGLTPRYKKLGVISFDAYGSLHTEATTPNGDANGMPLAIALGKAGLQLSDVAAGAAPIPKENLVMIGFRHLDASEKEIILAEGITYFSMYDIDQLGIKRVIERAVEVAGAGTDGIHLSMTADCLDPLEAPGVGFPLPGGLSYREAHFACELLAETGRITSMDIAEVNGAQDVNRRTARLAVGLIASVLGKRII
ncbi:arginase [Paenibacillus sp. TRM 82003]|nr:arginase [Paenibacillus sp. TRM 82003]